MFRIQQKIIRHTKTNKQTGRSQPDKTISTGQQGVDADVGII